MTIDELLEIAARHVRSAVDDPDTDCAMRYAATAQAAAQTAQAMILAHAMPPTSEGLMRVLQIDSGKP